MRKTILYGPRVQGDLDIGLEPTRLDGAGNKQWARIDGPGGRLPGQPYQDILEEVTTARYRVGTRRVVGNRVFHYCYATIEGGLDAAHAPVPAPSPPWAQVGCFYNSNVHYHGNGATQVTVPINATEFEWAYALAPTRRGNIGIAAHQLKDGLFVSYAERACYEIADNDAYVSSNGDVGTVHLYLKERVWQEHWTAPGATSYVYANTYAQCVGVDPGISHDGLPFNLAARLGYASVVAVPLIYMTAPCYFWGQTWGPLPLINGLWGINVGDTPRKTEVHFDWLGKIVYRDGAEATDAHMQRAGFILSSQFIMLQLAP